jgi:hypothetical protein
MLHGWRRTVYLIIYNDVIDGIGIQVAVWRKDIHEI